MIKVEKHVNIMKINQFFFSIIIINGDRTISDRFRSLHLIVSFAARITEINNTLIAVD
jgi:hypothetical protein